MGSDCQAGGTTYSVDVFWTSTPQTYVADITPNAGPPDGSNVVAVSNGVTVAPQGDWSVTLSTTSRQLLNGQTATLTATTNQSLSGTTWSLSIYDVTTGQRIGNGCSGSGCSAGGTAYTIDVNWAATPQTYVADITPYGGSPDSSGVIAVSDGITIDPAPWALQLSTDRTVLPNTQTAELTAVANQSVDGAYDIAIYDLTTGQRVDYCVGSDCQAGGTTYKTDASWAATPQTYVADIAPNAGPPDGSNVVAVSNPVTILPAAWTVTLTNHGPNGSLLTAEANQDVLHSGYWIEIYDAETRQPVQECEGGTVCSTGVDYMQPAMYIAFVAVAAGSATYPPPFVGRSGVVWAPSAGSCDCVTGDPVYPGTGDLQEPVTDYAISDPGPGLTLSRTYNSFDSEFFGPFGFGWASNVGMALSIDPAGTGSSLDSASVVDVIDEAGRATSFVNPNLDSTDTGGFGFVGLGHTSAGGFQPETTRGALTTGSATTYRSALPALGTLTQNGDGSFTLVRRGGTSFDFDASGRLTGEIDRNGERVALAYGDGSSATEPLDSPQTMTDPSGRTLTFAYNTDGHVSAVTDPAGRVTRYSYSKGELASVTDATGAVTSYTYDSDHKLLTITDPNGDTLTNTYDGSGRATSQTDYAGRTTTFTYHDDNTVTITDPRGDQTLNSYDANKLVAQTAAAGTSNAATTSLHYDPSTLGITSVTDPDGQTWKYTYDAAGNRTSATDPAGDSITATYNSFDEPLTFTDANGVTTTMAYDGSGNLQSVSRPIDSGRTAVTSYGYTDPANPGLPTTVTDPRGNPTTFSYDANGDLTSVTAPDGEQTTYNYGCASGCENGIGWLYSSVSPRGNVAGADPAQFTTSLTRDLDGRVTSVTDPLGHTASEVYDPNGTVTSVTDARGQTTTYTYDGDNELLASHRPDGHDLSTGYDADGNVLTQTNAAGYTTTYTYNPRDQLASTTTPPTATNPAGITTTYGYDPAGYLATITQPGDSGSSVVTTNHYDPAGRLTGRTYSDATPAVSYGYDANGRRTSMSDGTGTNSYTYNLAGWLTSTTNGAGLASAYTYDLDGDPTEITYPNGRTAARSYNADRQLTSTSDWHDKTTTFGYDQNGNLAVTTYPNGVTETSTYGANDTMSALADTLGSSTLASYSYSRDPNTALTGQTATGSNAAPSESYGYDTLGRLTGYTTSAPGVTGGALSYDPAGNLTGQPDGTTLSYDPAPELTGTTNPNGVTYADGYDPRGDRTSSTPNQGPATTLGYDAANQLTSYTNGATAASYRYDGDGLRTAKTVNGVTSQFSYDPVTGSVPLILTDGHENFIYGPNDTAIEQIGTSTPISYVFGKGTADTTGDATSLTVSFGAFRPQAGDQILLVVNENVLVQNQQSEQKANQPAGYTTVGDYQPASSAEDTVIFRRTATGTESGASVSFAEGLLATHPKTLTAVVYRGVDPVNPIDGHVAANGTGEGQSSVAVGRVTTTTDGDQLVLAEDALNTPPNTTWTPPNDMTPRPGAAVSAALVSSAIADKPMPLAGLSSPGAASTSGAGALEAVLIPLRHANATQYLQHDQLGSTRLITDPAGIVTGHYDYTPYAQTIDHSGPDSTPLQFNGQYQDTESGLYYFRARFYDPQTATFLTTDPLEALTGTPYSYANDDPLNVVDPSGLCWICLSTVTKIGIGLGALGLAASGVGLIADAAGAAALAGTAETAGVALGAGAAAADAAPCVMNRDAGACVGAAAGGLGALVGGGALLQGAGDIARGLSGVGGVGFGAAGVTWDVGCFAESRK